MAESKKIVLTSEGYAKIQEELEHLKVVRRKEVAQKINEARSQGDLSENAEYDAAKEEQAEIEARIVELDNMIRNAEVIAEDELNSGHVSLGNTVKLFDEEFQEDVTYSIVGSAEADPEQGRISNESPLGTALIGHVIGDIVEVNAPDGVITFKILDIM
ncbi:MAG: transcription elongation factor GreA [Firmicutes bacterium]|nr:transcription elongation factor GreA [Bacillota bacterium]